MSFVRAVFLAQTIPGTITSIYYDVLIHFRFILLACHHFGNGQQRFQKDEGGRETMEEPFDVDGNYKVGRARYRLEMDTKTLPETVGLPHSHLPWGHVV